MTTFPIDRVYSNEERGLVPGESAIAMTTFPIDRVYSNEERGLVPRKASATDMPFSNP